MNRDRVIGVALILTAVLAVVAVGAVTGSVSTAVNEHGCW